MADSSGADRRQFLKIGAGVVGGLVVGAAAAYVAKPTTTATTTETSTAPGTTVTSTTTGPASTLTSTATTTVTGSGVTVTNTSTTTATTTTTVSDTSSIASLQSEIAAYSGNSDAVVTLGIQEAAVVTALANTIIPSDSNGAGAVDAGVLYFIDRQLNGDYGNNGRMYNSGPFIMPQTAGPITVPSASGPITYSAGTVNANITWSAGQEYQYGMSLRNFWRYGILALESYANSAYGGNYETLSAANQLACLQDLFNNKPTTASFNQIIPSDFANEVFFMTWAGFISDPEYGGNRGMVGWILTASPGLNNGDFYGEGLTTKQLMVATTPTILKPVSLSQFQQAQGVSGVLGGSG